MDIHTKLTHCRVITFPSYVNPKSGVSQNQNWKKLFRVSFHDNWNYALPNILCLALNSHKLQAHIMYSVEGTVTFKGLRTIQLKHSIITLYKFSLMHARCEAQKTAVHYRHLFCYHKTVWNWGSVVTWPSTKRFVSIKVQKQWTSSSCLLWPSTYHSTPF